MTNYVKKILLIYVFAVSLVSIARADLAERINGIISQKSHAKVEFAIKIIKADTGLVVYSRNANKPMIPASNMKTVVTAAALKYLGPDFKYQTKVGLCGNTLVVKGSGDPLLGHGDPGRILDDITDSVKQHGIETINDIIVDSSIFDDQRTHPNWPADQLNRDYACEVSGLNFNGNCIDVSTKKIGDRVSVSLAPKTKYVKIINKVKPISKGKGAVGSYRTKEENKIVVFGKCKNADGPFAVAIERPAAFFGFLLYEKFIASDISVTGRLVGKSCPADCRLTILAEYSTPLSLCLEKCNKDSFSLAAEAILKTISANGTWVGGREAVSRYLIGLGIDKKEFYIDDGSGLSRENRLSPNAVTAVLYDVYKSKNRRLYKDSLAAGGGDGTIARYFKEPKYKGKILGKTGYIAGVKSFSGICQAADADYIFSILTTNTNGKTRGAINDIAKAIIDDNK